MKGAELSVELRNKPQQRRGAQTISHILDSAAKLLEKRGFEKLSTNAICEAAGITPPALYRYFPNKYAVMKALGERLMEAQNSHLLHWRETQFDFANLETSLKLLLQGQLRATQDQVAGAWIMRSLHSIPLLSEVRIESHDAMTDALIELYEPHLPTVEKATLHRALRMGIEIGYTMLEYLTDVPDANEDAVIDDAARLLAMQAAMLSGTKGE